MVSAVRAQIRIRAGVVVVDWISSETGGGSRLSCRSADFTHVRDTWYRIFNLLIYGPRESKSDGASMRSNVHKDQARHFAEPKVGQPALGEGQAWQNEKQNSSVRGAN